MSAHDSGQPRVRLLIVDDSALMRKLLADILGSAPEIEVVGLARDGAEAVELNQRLRPDVITLDVEMPGRSGLDILPELLATHPASVLMVSSYTQAGADVTLAALELGAIDFFPKPDRHQFTQIRECRDLLVAKVLAAAQCKPRPGRPVSPRTPAAAEPRAREPHGEHKHPAPSSTYRCIVIGISTGGPQALGSVLPHLAPPLPPILIVQHMPAPFTSVFAQRLDRACNLAVKEAEEGDKLVANQILVAPGGRQMGLAGRPPSVRISLSDGPAVSGHKPSIDYLFERAARIFQAGTIGFIMTGMGRDGVEGCRKILAAGGVTHGQDEATSAVYGMNKVAFLEKVILGQFPLEEFPNLARKLASAR